MDYFKEITSRVEAWYENLKKENPFFIKIFDGTLTPQELGAYLYNIQFSLQSTIPQCRIGAEISRQKGWDKLAAYFETKVGEETGHDQWARDDVDSVKKSFPSVPIPDKISAEMKKAIAYNYELVNRDPRLFLVYMLFSEYFTVKAGPECMEALDRKGNLSRNLVTVVDTHVELDREHVYEWGVEVKECGVDFTSLSDQVFEALNQCMQNYGNFWAAVVTKDEGHGHQGNTRAA